MGVLHHMYTTQWCKTAGEEQGKVDTLKQGCRLSSSFIKSNIVLFSYINAQWGVIRDDESQA